MAATLREIMLMATSAKQRPEKPRALVSPGRGFDEDRTPPKQQSKTRKPEGVNIAMNIHRNFEFPD
jgi:hypothetical protein